MSARNPAAELSPAALIRGSVAPEETRTTQESWAWRAMEASITLGILLLVVLSVADSVHAAGWVDGMPDVRLTALLALGVAVGMSTGLVHWTLAYVGGIGLGAVVVLRQVLQMEQFTGQSWFWERFVELRFRLEDWFSQAFNDGITTDNVPFVFFVVVGVWLATFPAALLVLRRRNPWPMLIVLGVLLSINVSYLDGKQWDFHFAFFAAGAALLVMRTSLLTRMARWQERGTPFPDFISVSFFAVTLVGVVGLMVVSRAVPRPDRADPLTQFWSGITSPFDDLSLEFERLFSGIDSQRGAPIHNFGANFILQGDISPGQGIVVRVDAPEVGLLRGASYDRYTTRGWQQSAIITSAPIPQEAFRGEAESPYLERREVETRLSVEQSPRVLFTFGLPTAISRAVLIDETAPVQVTLDIENGGRGAPAELVPVAEEIAAREAEGESFSAEVILAGWVPVGSVVADDGALLALELENRPAEPDVVTVHPDDSVRAGFTYSVSGSVSTASVDELKAAGGDYPFWVEQRYLQLPSDLDDTSLGRLRSLAEGIVAGTQTRYDFAAAIEGYLCCTPLRDASGAVLLNAEGEPRLLYPFTTDIPVPPLRVDAVTWWLLDNLGDDGLPIGGYYDYHASALAVLLRTLGVPARVSTGYVLTEDNFDTRTGTFIVRGQDAYSWVEVFFPEYGWVDFDPTPPVVSQEFGSIAGQRIAAQRLRPFASDVLPDGLDDVFGELGTFEEFLLLEELLNTQLTDFARDSESSFQLWWVLAPLAAAGATGGGGFAVWRLSLRGQTPVERLWTSTQRLSQLGGLRTDPSDTPNEYADVLGKVVRHPEATRTLAQTYTRARFGPGELSEADYVEAQGAWRAVRGRLLRRVLRLPVPKAPLVAETTMEPSEAAAETDSESASED